MLLWPTGNLSPGNIKMVQVPIPHLKEVSLTHITLMHGLIISPVLCSHLPSSRPVISAQTQPLCEADFFQVLGYGEL